MRVMVEVNVEQFSVEELLFVAGLVGCPINTGNKTDIIKWLIRKYGRSLLDKMAEFKMAEGKKKDLIDSHNSTHHGNLYHEDCPACQEESPNLIDNL